MSNTKDDEICKCGHPYEHHDCGLMCDNADGCYCELFTPKVSQPAVEVGEDVLLRISDYLQKGGLFNPELMEHDKVGRLILDCRTVIESHLEQLSALTKENQELRKYVRHLPQCDIETCYSDSKCTCELAHLLEGGK